MATNLEFVRAAVGTDAIRGAAEGRRLAAVLTEGEIVVGRAGILGRQWGSKLDRFDLSRLTDVLLVPCHPATMLLLKFAGTPPVSVAVMYDPDQRGAFEPMIGELQSRAASNGGAAAAAAAR